MPKKQSKSKNKAVTGSARRLNNLSITKKGALFALVAILAFSIASGVGLQNWQDDRIKAQAGTQAIWIYSLQNYVRITACKQGRNVAIYATNNSPNWITFPQVTGLNNLTMAKKYSNFGRLYPYQQKSVYFADVNSITVAGLNYPWYTVGLSPILPTC